MGVGSENGQQMRTQFETQVATVACQRTTEENPRNSRSFQTATQGTWISSSVS